MMLNKFDIIESDFLEKIISDFNFRVGGWVDQARNTNDAEESLLLQRNGRKSPLLLLFENIIQTLFLRYWI